MKRKMKSKIAGISAYVALTALGGGPASMPAQAREVCYQNNCYDPFPDAVSQPAPAPVKISPADALKAELADVGVERFTAPDYKPGILQHVVLFRYQDSVTAEQKEEVKTRFLALKQNAVRNGRPYILQIQTGSQNSGEGVDQGLEQAFVVTFKSEGDRNYYVGSPVVTDSRYFDAAHQTFKDFVGPLLHQNPLGVLVFDFNRETAK